MEDFAFVWKSLVLVFAGLVLLRIAGRKSISQMTIGTTIIMISIGSLIVQPLANEYVWKAVVSTALFVAFLIIVEMMVLKFDFIERLVQGTAVPLIRDGQIVEDNLRKLRMTVDKLEMRLRQQGIAKISDVKNATLESNGQIGYELKKHARPVTVGDMEKLLGIRLPDDPKVFPDTMFDEANQNRHPQSIPKHLQ